MARGSERDVVRGGPTITTGPRTEERFFPDLPPSPERWFRKGGHPSGPVHPTVAIDRNLSVTATELDNKIPLIYAPASEPIRIHGFISFLYDFKPLKFIGLVVSFAHGPLESLAGFEINRIPIADCSFVNKYGSSVGPLTGKTGYSFLQNALQTLNFVEVYPGKADLGLLLRTDDPNMPSSLDITALCGGRIITDYRTAGTGASGNPALIGYDILTLPEIGMGIDPTRVDTGVGGTWRDKADLCDDVMSDGSKRYEFAGALTSDPWLALPEVLDLAFLEPSSDGELITLFGWDCPDPVVDAFEIGLDDTKGPLLYREIPLQRRPNSVSANYQIGEDGESGNVLVEVDGIDEDTIRPQEISRTGLRKRTVAKRVATKIVNMGLQDTHERTGSVRAEIMEGVKRGDIGKVTTHDGEVEVRYRVLHVGEPLKGWCDVEMILYGPTTDSEDVEDDADVLPRVTIDPPPIPTTYTEKFIHIGPWLANSLVGDEPDDLLTGGWVATAATTDAVYDGTEVATIVNPKIGQTTGTIRFSTFSIPSTADAIKLTVAFRYFDNIDYTAVRVRVLLNYSGGNLWQREATPPSDRYVTASWGIRLDSLAATPDRIFITITTSDTSLAPEVAIKQAYLVPAGTAEVDTKQYKITSRHEWVHPSDPDDEIKGYRAIKKMRSGTYTLSDLDNEDDDFDYPLVFEDIPLVLPGIIGSAYAEDIVSDEQVIQVLSPYLIRMQSVGAVLVSDFSAPVQSWSTAVTPPEQLTITSHVYNLSDLLEEPNEGRDATNWANIGTGTVAVTANVDTAPDGTTTADKLTKTVAGTASRVDDEWYPQDVFGGELIIRTVWVKKSGTNSEIELETLEGNGCIGYPVDSCSAVWYLRAYYRMAFLEVVVESGAGPPLSPIYGGPAVRPVNLNDEVIVWSAGYRPRNDSRHYHDLKISWVAPESPWLISHLRFQYKMARRNGGSYVYYDWTFWGDEIRVENLSVVIGNSEGSNVPWFPLTDPSLHADARLYDWRLVAVSVDGATVTEVGDPSSVTIETNRRTVNILGANDFNQSTRGASSVMLTDSANAGGEFKPLSEFVTSDGPSYLDEVSVTINASNVLAIPASGTNFRVSNYLGATTDSIDNITGGTVGRLIKLRAASASQVFVLNDKTKTPTSTVILADGIRLFSSLVEEVTLIHDGTNWRQISQANEYVWDDVRFDAFDVGAAGFTPSPAVLATNGAGSRGVATPARFTANQYLDLSAHKQLRHGYMPGSDFVPHIHWYPQATPGPNTYGIVWEIEYLIIPYLSTFGNSTVITVTDSIVNPVAKKHYISVLPTISGTGITESSMIHIRFGRIGNNVADTLPTGADLGEVDFHTRFNKRGTAYEYPV